MVSTSREDSLALKNHLLFRDYLRNNTEAGKEYSQLKFELAEKTDDMGEYIEGKTEFITKALSKVGVEINDLQEIEAVNKN